MVYEVYKVQKLLAINLSGFYACLKPIFFASVVMVAAKLLIGSIFYLYPINYILKFIIEVIFALGMYISTLLLMDNFVVRDFMKMLKFGI